MINYDKNIDIYSVDEDKTASEIGIDWFLPTADTVAYSVY